MNNVQEKVFELFEYFVHVCDCFHLRWYLINGSALGAMKYNGFIPWDDDLDVGMPRDDYEIFLQKAQAMLPEHVFVQNYRTDKNFPHIYSKLRNSETAFIESGVRHLDMNHGIFIDVFPLDGFHGDKIEKKNRFAKKIINWKIACAFNDRSSFKIRFRNKIFKSFGCHKRTAVYLEKFEKNIQKSWNDCEFVCNHGDRMGKKKILPKEYYGDGASAVFEGMEVQVPSMTDEYLTHKYGDWRADLPDDAKVSHHTTEICDTTVSYKKYIVF